MPVFIFRYDSTLSPLYLDTRKLALALPSIIATALDVPENPNARLNAGDIEIWPSAWSGEEINVKKIAILGFAHDYIERFANIDQRIEQIRQGIVVKGFNVEVLGPAAGWIWVHLNKTGFVRLNG